MLFWCLQAKLEQELHNGHTTEQVLERELAALRQQLQQARQDAEQASADGQAVAAANSKQHIAELELLRRQLEEAGAAQVQGCAVGLMTGVGYSRQQLLLYREKLSMRFLALLPLC